MTMNTTHAILQSDTIFQGHAFSVELILTRLPDGNQKVYELVRHREAVTLVPIDPAGKIYFVRQYRIGAGQALLELPAGVLEPDEDPAGGAGREVREETGLAAGKLLKLGEFYMAPGYSSELIHVFLATDLYPAPLEADDDEFLEVESMPVQQVYEMLDAGLIKDGKTLAALLLARPYLLLPSSENR
jgi:ADP-ribose pyrophosphatase